MTLTAFKVKHAKPGRHTDGRGLSLLVRPTGGKFWVLRVQHNGCRRELGLGSAHDVGLEEARYSAALMRRRIKQGFDPISERAEDPAPSIGTKRRISFEYAARECYQALKEGWDDRRRANWISSLENHVFPMIGKRPVEKIDSAAVVGVLAPIWLKIPDTSRRILQRINSVLDFAHIKGWRAQETSLRGVRKGLPRQTDRKRHYAAMDYSETGNFMRSLRNEEPTAGRDALRFLIFTAARSSEVRNAVWSEIDLTKGIWSIPADRMKSRRPHNVPLPSPALAILKRLNRNRGPRQDFIFSSKGEKPLSDATLTRVLREAGVAMATVHGFRSSFTDWAAEETDFPKEIVGKALAHVIPNRVEAAYRRTDFFEKRRKLMNKWAYFLERGVSKPKLPESVAKSATASQPS